MDTTITDGRNMLYLYPMMHGCGACVYVRARVCAGIVASRYTVSGSGTCPQRVLLPRGKIACRTVCHVSQDKISRWSRCRASARFAYERHDADWREVVRKHLRALIGKVNHVARRRRSSLLCCVPVATVPCAGYQRTTLTATAVPLAWLRCARLPAALHTQCNVGCLSTVYWQHIDSILTVVSRSSASEPSARRGRRHATRQACSKSCSKPARTGASSRTYIGKYVAHAKHATYDVSSRCNAAEHVAT